MRIKQGFLIIFSFVFVVSGFAQQKVEITSVLKDKFFDKNGNPLTGKGVVIGDIDSGIDIFHPMFFFADGGTFSWIDVNGDGEFTPGIDVVDINGNGKIDKSQVLRILKMKNDTWNLISADDPREFNPQYDFLYIDKNGNKKRDYGTASGFTESDPGYGEPMFIVLDENHNGKLDVGEKIVMLKTSKVRAVREKNGTVRRRGTDLIYTEEDSIGHGTGVAGILLGGHSGVEKIQGFAPDAELVMADIQYDYTPRFVRNFPEMIKFERDEKVNVLLFEDGEWMWEFMDGSSPEEEMVDEMARDGIPVVGGAGNFTEGNMMIIDTLNDGESTTYKISAAEMHQGQINNGLFASVLWTDSTDNISFSVRTPDDITTPPLTGGSDFISAGKYNIFYSRDISPKGTVMFRFAFSKKDSGAVNGTWKINLKNEKSTIIRAYVVDVSQGWEGNSHWVSDKVT